MQARIVIIAMVFFSGVFVSAQGLKQNWKNSRKEVSFTCGATAFFGDLGGADLARHYSPADMNLSQSRVAIGIGFSYKVKPWLNVGAKLVYAGLRGDDAEAQNVYRKNRNLNFKTHLIEFAPRVEVGHSWKKFRTTVYRFRHLGGRPYYHSLYAFAGIGAFYSDPKGRTDAGNYIALRPLHTEGQGLPGGPKQYARVNACIPLGFYYKVTIQNRWSFGIEVAWRMTFTDYIDDVGSTYYDAAALNSNYGYLSAKMANPHLGLIAGSGEPAADGSPAVRGGSRKDSYATVELRVGYVIAKQRSGRRIRAKF